jgi:hypothetical protein
MCASTWPPIATTPQLCVRPRGSPLPPRRSLPLRPRCSPLLPRRSLVCVHAAAPCHHVAASCASTRRPTATTPQPPAASTRQPIATAPQPCMRPRGSPLPPRRSLVCVHAAAHCHHAAASHCVHAAAHCYHAAALYASPRQPTATTSQPRVRPRGGPLPPRRSLPLRPRGSPLLPRRSLVCVHAAAHSHHAAHLRAAHSHHAAISHMMVPRSRCAARSPHLVDVSVPPCPIIFTGPAVPPHRCVDNLLRCICLDAGSDLLSESHLSHHWISLY